MRSSAAVMGAEIEHMVRADPSIILLAAFLLLHLHRFPWTYDLYQNSAVGSIQMEQRFVSRTDGIPNDARVWSLISDLDRTARQLDCDILAEEKRAKIFDPLDATYPLLAQSLRTRRNNLRATITTLELKAGAPTVQSAA